MKTKKIAATTLGFALLAGGGLGASLLPSVASAADSSSSTSTVASTTKDTPGEWMRTALTKLVTAGTLTQAQADAVTKALDAARPDGGPGGGPGHREGGPGLTVAAKALGMSAADLRTALRSGTTIAAVAKAHNVDLQTVITALVAEENTHLAQAVTDGHLTQAQADARQANATQRATDMVNGVRPTAPPPS